MCVFAEQGMHRRRAGETAFPAAATAGSAAAFAAGVCTHQLLLCLANFLPLNLKVRSLTPEKAHGLLDHDRAGGKRCPVSLR